MKIDFYDEYCGNMDDRFIRWREYPGSFAGR